MHVFISLLQEKRCEEARVAITNAQKMFEEGNRQDPENTPTRDSNYDVQSLIKECNRYIDVEEEEKEEKEEEDGGVWWRWRRRR
eukprot:COSAG01_NODE_12572_length_1717_cov_11.346106_2_plen_84_part_00